MSFSKKISHKNDKEYFQDEIKELRVWQFFFIALNDFWKIGSQALIKRTNPFNYHKKEQRTPITCKTHNDFFKSCQQIEIKLIIKAYMRCRRSYRLIFIPIFFFNMRNMRRIGLKLEVAQRMSRIHFVSWIIITEVWLIVFSACKLIFIRVWLNFLELRLGYPISITKSLSLTFQVKWIFSLDHFVYKL